MLNPANLGGNLPFTVKMDIYEWLVVTAKGQALNFSTGIAANSIFRTDINPPVGYDYMLYHALQWDGITPGTVTFELRGGTSSLIAGFAIQTFIQDELFITDRGRPIHLTVNNSSTAPVVMNLDFIAMQAETWEREVLPLISPIIPGGH